MKDLNTILQQEVEGSVAFFLKYTNLEAQSQGFGLTLDSTKDLRMCSIAATGFALSAWVIACERGILTREQALEITRGTLRTLLHHVPHYHGFFAHFVDFETAARWGKCEYSTIDTGLCLNGVITVAAYFQDDDVQALADELLNRVDWRFIVFQDGATTLFHMAYNPDLDGDYVDDKPGFVSRWDMAAEQKMMYFQAANQLEPEIAQALYKGFRRDTKTFDGHDFIVNPAGTLFVHHFSEAWFDSGQYLDPDGVSWFENTRIASLANRAFCIQEAKNYQTYHERSWGLSAGDSPWGYEVAGSAPSLIEPPLHTGTVSIYSALSCLPFIPTETLDMIAYLYQQHPQTWGEYGFFDAYNTAVTPPWYSTALYGIDKGCSMILIENYLSGLIWKLYTDSPTIQYALRVLGFRKQQA